jgi:hypothetical protein
VPHLRDGLIVAKVGISRSETVFALIPDPCSRHFLSTPLRQQKMQIPSNDAEISLKINLDFVS